MGAAITSQKKNIFKQPCYEKHRLQRKDKTCDLVTSCTPDNSTTATPPLIPTGFVSDYAEIKLLMVG